MIAARSGIRRSAFRCRLHCSVRDAARQAGYAHMDIVSGAGHDAGYINRVAPTAMIFVPCADGISHNEIEAATPADLAAGCNVLMRAMLAQAG
jgi:N-carbamoyl-L-amino-acid hydrolase